MAQSSAAGSPPTLTCWSSFGAVVPVLAGSAGAGASVCAAALVDTLQAAGRCAVLVDGCEGPGSGLAGAVSSDGPWARELAPGSRVRFSWRQHALLARLEHDDPTQALDPGSAPRPHQWLPSPAPTPLHATVIDLGHQWASPWLSGLEGPREWLGAGHPAPRPLLVVRPTRPSLMAAETALARLDDWIRTGEALGPARLVVVGTRRRRWPSGVIGAAGSRVGPLLAGAVHMPYDRSLELAGITDAPLPARVTAALFPLARALGLLGGQLAPPSDHSISPAGLPGEDLPC